MELLMSDKIDEVEKLVVVGAERRSFEQLMLEKAHNKCGNCGGEHKVRVRMIVPIEAGGQKVESNATVLCRACEMATETLPQPGSEGKRRIINFWVSRRLHDRMTNGMTTSRGLKSMSALVRYLMSTYVTDPLRFDDLPNYQDSASNDVKLNVWVPIDQYETFKTLVNDRGMSVTDTITCLILMFDQDVIQA